VRGTHLRERPSAGAVSKPAARSGKPKTPPRLQDLSVALQTRPPLFFMRCPTPDVIPSYSSALFETHYWHVREDKKRPALVWTAGAVHTGRIRFSSPSVA
jgi:hypothetical protein